VRIVLDTDVFVSGVFFKGIPSRILAAWAQGKVQLVVCEEILEEYERVGEVLSEGFPGVELGPILELLVMKAELTSTVSLPEPVCEDPDDDKFLACAIASGCSVVVSGDKHLLKVSGYRGVIVLKPREFHRLYLDG
jgi:putative PIN family toxin of toxin-antitoxin system